MPENFYSLHYRYDAIEILSPIETVSPCKANIIHKNPKNMQQINAVIMLINGSNTCTQYNIFKIGS